MIPLPRKKYRGQASASLGLYVNNTPIQIKVTEASMGSQTQHDRTFPIEKAARNQEIENEVARGPCST